MQRPMVGREDEIARGEKKEKERGWEGGRGEERNYRSRVRPLGIDETGVRDPGALCRNECFSTFFFLASRPKSVSLDCETRIRVIEDKLL